MPLARLLLVLAHHPDLDQEEGDSLDTLKIIAKYIDFYIECVVNRDNVGLLYHIAAKVKSVKGLAPNGEPDEDNTVRRRRCKMELELILELVQAGGNRAGYHPEQERRSPLGVDDIPRQD